MRTDFEEYIIDHFGHSTTYDGSMSEWWQVFDVMNVSMDDVDFDPRLSPNDIGCYLVRWTDNGTVWFDQFRTAGDAQRAFERLSDQYHEAAGEPYDPEEALVALTGRDCDGTPAY